MGLADCVLIMPADSNRGDDIRQLASGPCFAHGFRIMESGDHIAFSTAPLAIALIGSNNIDPAIALLVGYRLSARRTTLLLTESGSPTSSQQTFYSMINTLSGVKWKAVPIPADLDNMDANKAAIDEIDAAIVAALKKTSKVKQQYRSHPYVEFRFDRQTNECPCTTESSNAFSFFGYKNSIVGVDAKDLVEHMVTLFYEPQKEKFLEDQGQLMAEILAPVNPFGQAKNSVLWAKYPAVFQNHPDPEFNEHAFLPIIVSNSADDRYITLSVLYLEINSVTELEEDQQAGSAPSEPRFVCKLKLPWQRLPFFVRPGYDVFLAHNSTDKAAVRNLNESLSRQGIRPFFDETAIEAGALLGQLADAIKQSCTTAIIIGPEGLGAWQQNFEMVAIMQRAIREEGHNVIPVLLPGVEEIPDSFSYLEGFAYVKFESLEDLEANDEFKKLVRFIKTPAKTGNPQLAGKS